LEPPQTGPLPSKRLAAKVKGFPVFQVCFDQFLQVGYLLYD
jgi:hypothetical protein